MPTDAALKMYSENAKKSKDPEVLLSYAQFLMKTALTFDAKKSGEDVARRKMYLIEAHRELRRASRTGSIDAQYYLGEGYFNGIFNHGKSDYSKALGYFEPAGKLKHAESAYLTSLCYRKGYGCNRDSKKALKYVEISAMNGHPVAMMEFGIFCFHGLLGLSDDINVKKKGISWLNRATEVATVDSAAAPFELGLIYLNGFKDIVIKDTKYAVCLLLQACNLGHPKATSMLGSFYELGEIVEFNPRLSFEFYKKAAYNGDAEELPVWEWEMP
ncbi:unnamed protein product [Ambrosiozyma monospora]|uniref:Unnamed protein product n=1 Tax=Ambrosiozyma monospora TaxID=43982 RepID=A0ACB5U3D2_AMBMO|nr:unnamed protein product [Ambrosiozyma monospora]